MCFSPEASFTVAAGLLVAGSVLARRFLHDPKFLIALIPIFFALQQFSEGILWVALKQNTYPNAWSVLAQNIFLFFAYMFWPVWMPLAFLTAEKVAWRRRFMILSLAFGVWVFLYVVYHWYFYWNTKAEIVQHSISYGESSLLHKIAYVIVVLTPFFLSSIPRIWMLGIAISFFYILSLLVYQYAFTSIWCFFAAIVCSGLFIVFKDVKKSGA